MASPSEIPSEVGQNEKVGEEHGAISLSPKLDPSLPSEGPRVQEVEHNHGGVEVNTETDGSGIQVSLAHLIVLLAVLWVGVFFPVLDETMIATILDPISVSFASFSKLSWIASTYVIGMSAATPISGHLTNIFGRRYGFLVVTCIFLVGTLICGLSPSLPVFLLGRAVAGVGGGSMGSISAFIETDLVSLRNRGITEGIGGIVYGVAIAVGGLFGGGINDALSWRWAFLSQAPIIAGVMILVWFLVTIPIQTSVLPTIRRIDFVGSFTLIAGIVLMQLGLQSGEQSHTWSDAVVVASLPMSIVSFTVFVVWDLKFAPEPVLPLRKLLRRNLILSSVFYFCELMSYMTLEFYVPIYLQVLGLSTTQVGLRFLPQAICAAVATFAAGFWVKAVGTWYWINVVIQACNVLGSGLMLLLNSGAPQWYPFVFLALSGIGFGGSWVTVMMAVMSTVSSKDQATIQSAGYLLRTLGMTLGLVIASIIFQKILSDQLWAIFEDLSEEGSIVHKLLDDFNALQKLGEESKVRVQEGYMTSLHAVFLLTFGESLVAAAASICMKHYPIPEGPRE